MKSHLPVRVLIALNLLLGLILYRDYGESWDVNSLRHYADGSLSMYGRLASGGILPAAMKEELPLGNYGPAYVMLVRTLERLSTPSSEGPYPVQHLAYFLTFQVGVGAFYILCLRWMNQPAAFGAAVLFSTQPVFWGHGFINPKDIPLMSFFLLALLLGFRMVDSLQPLTLPRPALPVSILIGAVPLLAIFFGSGIILAWIENLVRAAAEGKSNFISWMASDIAAAPAEVYIQKYSTYYLLAAFSFLLLWIPALLLYYRRLSPPLFSALATALPAAAVLGMTTSVRNLGLFAGLLVAAHAYSRHGSRVLIHLAFYALMTAVVMYLLWPYLWVNPVRHLYESMVVMARYPWDHPVLFNGSAYSVSDLPKVYLPVLLGIQLTEPVWLLFIVGLVISMLSWREKSSLLQLATLWLFLPLVGFIAAGAVLYDNFRQILFVLPPIFLLAGIAFEHIRRPWLQALVIALCALPGAVGIVRLHPYEYIYYNSYVGGVGGAFRRFELDYWGTSYRAAAEYVDSVAPSNATIWVEGPAHLFDLYARNDLQIYSTHELETAPHYDYVIATTRYDLDLASYPAARIIHEVSRGEAVLAVVKQP